MHKFGLIGTSCAGKTTLAHALTGRLKEYGVLVDGVYSQDRKLTFDVSFLETEAAQNWMVSNFITQEIAMSLRTDVEVLLSDRTPLDLLAYYAYQFPESLQYQALKSYVFEYCKGYEALYYLEPLVYQADNKRPTDEFRIAVDSVLLELIQEAQEHGVTVKKLSRPKVLEDVLHSIGFKKPHVKQELSPIDCQAIANMAGRDICVKHGTRRDLLSDTDIWVLYDKDLSGADARTRDLQHLIKGHFGAYVNVDLHVGHAGSLHTFDFPYTIYSPEVPT